MTQWDINRRIYECLKEIYTLTHIEQLGERSEPPYGEPSLEFDPLEINSLEGFNTNPSLYVGKEWGPEEVVLP